MLTRLHLRNFTVFADAEFAFSPGLNVIVGTNGTGKSHVLKLGYAAELAYAAPSGIEENILFGNKTAGEKRLTHDLISRLDEVFLSKGLHKLVRRASPASDYSLARAEAEVQATFDTVDVGRLEFTFDFSNSHSSLTIHTPPTASDVLVQSPVFIPAKEILSLMPSIVGVSEQYANFLDLTYTRLARLLLAPTRKKFPGYLVPILQRLTQLLQGSIKAEDGRFYLVPEQGEVFEIGLIAEGQRKIGMLAHLLANGSLNIGSTIYWDEPEANLNPALLRHLAALLVILCQEGFQIILATHSLFLLKEFHILARREQPLVRYFGLFQGPAGDMQVETTDDFETLAHVAALDAELEQTVDFQQALDQEDADHS